MMQINNIFNLKTGFHHFINRISITIYCIIMMLNVMSLCHHDRCLAMIIRRKLCTRSEKHQKIYDRIIRVDHAGELGADRIYAGQMAVLGNTDVGPLIQHMWDQEKNHLRTFNEMIPKYRVRPTIMNPIWNVAGYVLGAGCALISKEAAMACTVAVEESISEHYNNQIRELLELENPPDHSELLETIKQFRNEEMEHHDIGLEHDATEAPGFNFIKKTIQLGCTSAIWLSERI